MKVLIYTASSMCNPQLGIQTEKAIEYVNKGYDVIFCYCAGVMNACSANPYKNKALCKLCQIGFKAGIKQLPKSVKVVKLRRNKNYVKHQFIRFNSVSEIKSYKYKGVDVGFSCLSVFITINRNPNPIMTDCFLSGINKMIENAKQLVEAAEEIIKSEKPELIVFFNGRFYDTKPFLNLAEKNNVSFIATENVGGIRAGNGYKMVEFENRSPHDPHVALDCCLASWNKSMLPVQEKIQLGSNFYLRRRNGDRAGDYVYTGEQEKGKLPYGFDTNKKNVVVFTSSEDEFSAVSNEIDSFYLFSSQYEAIKYISENISDEDFHFYVRIHPNLKGLNVEYHRNLYKLRQLNNVTVISPEETISSYALMDASTCVVTFGSTIGAESLFWGKPVVLLGYSAYYYWNACSIPHSKEEVVDAIKNPFISSDAKDMAIKFGYYFLDNSLAEETKFINITPKQVSFLGHRLYVFDYLKIFNSSLLYRLIQLLYTHCFIRIHKNRIRFSS